MTTSAATVDVLDPDQACQQCLTIYTPDEPEAEHACAMEWVQP